jgi:CdiI N-terminal domain
MFDISLTDESVSELEAGVMAVYGQIRVGDFSETFVASLDSWNRDRYERHWKGAIAKIVDGSDRSALITSYVEPIHSTHLMWWPLYREKNSVYLQNPMLFYDQLKKPFSAEAPWDSVRERQTVSPEGKGISEWATDFDSLREFLQRTAYA